MDDPAPHDREAAIDFCPPTGSLLARCVLTGKGGRLVLVSSEPFADVTTVLLDSPERNSAFTALYEDAPPAPGTLRLRIPAADGERTVAGPVWYGPVPLAAGMDG